MSFIDIVRKALVQKEFNEEFSNLIVWEIIILAIGFGIYFLSWSVFFSILIGGPIIYMISPIIRFLFHLTLGVIGGILVTMIIGLLVPIWLAIIIGIIACVMIMVAHGAGFQSYDDLS